MPLPTLTEGSVYEVTYYASRHTGRTITRKLRLVEILFPDRPARETFKFASLRKDSFHTCLTAPEIIEFKEII